MTLKFNKLLFIDKIRVLKEQSELIRLASDGNYWRVKVLDSEIADKLEYENINFEIEQEWGASEICDLVYLLGIKNDDY